MSESYYKPCRNLNICNGLIEKYFQDRLLNRKLDGYSCVRLRAYAKLEGVAKPNMLLETEGFKCRIKICISVELACMG